MTGCKAPSLMGLVDVDQFAKWAATDGSRWEKLVGADAIHRLKGAAEVQKVASGRSTITVKVRFRRGRASQAYTNEEFTRAFLKINFGLARRK